MSEMTKSKTHLNGMASINPNLINDGLILSEKCKRDITAGITLSLDNYIAEFNRILETARKESPEHFLDIASASDTSPGKPQKTRSQLRLQTLYAVDLANDKLVSRLTGQINQHIAIKIHHREHRSGIFFAGRLHVLTASL